MEGLAYISCNT